MQEQNTQIITYYLLLSSTFILNFFSSLALTLLAVSLCGRHDRGSRSWDGDSCRGNHWPDAGAGCGLVTRGGAWLVARRWSTCGGADVGSGRVRQAGADGESMKSYFFANSFFVFVLYYCKQH